jgi:hypothetical protein
MTCVLLLDMFFTAADLARLRRCLTDTGWPGWPSRAGASSC